MKINISAVVLTKNEEANIEKCLKALDFCQERVVIDDESIDKTAEIAKRLGAQVYSRKTEGDFASQRNFGLEKEKGEWVLYVDADEVVNEELKKEIENVVETGLKPVSTKYVAYYLKRRDTWWGRELKYGEVLKTGQKGIIRLMKKDSGKWVGKVHEVFETKCPTGQLNSYLEHFPHPTLTDFLKDVNFYSTLRAKELYGSGKTTNIFEIVLLPFFKFILNYFIYLGFLDGPAGFAYAFLMSFHSFLVRAKLYQYASIDK